MTETTDKKLDTQDIPITSIDDDKLNRSKIVDSIVTAINSHDGEHSLTIGIEGPWGSGKTSIINIVKDKIESDKDYKDKYAILDFNPWMHMGTEQILVDFFRSMHNVLKSYNIGNKEKIIKLLKALASYAANFFDGAAVTIGVSVLLASISTQVSKRVSIKKPSINQQKEDLKKIMANNFDKKIICIIDDIDRLDADETLLIFKLTKIIADFPNMIFVLAYDRRRTASLISQKMNVIGTSNIEEDDMGDKFIQKIVQVVRPVPYSMDDIHKKYFMGLVESARFYQDTSDVEQYAIEYTYNNYLQYAIQTPRGIKRLISHIDLFLYSTKSSDIYIKDLLLIETMRMVEGKLYESVKNNKIILLGKVPLKQDERACIENYLSEGRPIDSTGISHVRYRAIQDIAELSSVFNRTIITTYIMSILSCEPKPHSIKGTHDEMYAHLCKNWDLYFSSGTASVNMDR